MSDLALIPRIAALYELQTALIGPQLKRLGMTLATFQLLAAVHGSGSKSSQAEIARRLGISPATLSEAVHSAIKAGLLEQDVSSTDRRVKTLKLTNKASKKLAEVLTELQSIEKSVVKKLSGKDIRRMNEGLDHCIQTMENLLESKE